jgi:hypothetical protein
MGRDGRVKALTMLLAPVSAGAVLVAAGLDPSHDPWADYVSWLSDGPYWWLAAAGVLGLGGTAALVARHLHTAMRGSARAACTTFLLCTAALAVAAVALPSRGINEPLWRTAAHVGNAVGAYAGVLGAAALVAHAQRKGRLTGPSTLPWAVGAAAALGLLGAASGAVRVLGWTADLRGAAQLLLVCAAAAWMAAAGRVRPPTAGVPG